MVEINVPSSEYLPEFKRLIGAIGEKCVKYYFEKEGFKVIGGITSKDEQMKVQLKDGTYYPAPFDYLLTNDQKYCIIEVKSTSKDKWRKKKYFNDHLRYERDFGHQFIDEYMRVKLELRLSVDFNDEDLENILMYFKDENKKPIYPREKISPTFFENKN